MANWFSRISVDVVSKRRPDGSIEHKPGKKAHLTCARCHGIAHVGIGTEDPRECPFCFFRGAVPLEDEGEIERKLRREARRLEREVMRLIQMDGIATDCPAVIKYEDGECDSDCDVCWNRYLRAVKDGLFYNVRGARSLETAIRKTLERDDAKRPPQAAKKGAR